mmetsp:Transcript_31504/g.27890  ORF Transcript_31504/g.27890 Transcript_31504/m.27890 type:complete len:105 (-) Transcript_31504:958-1272(-)
MVKEIINIDNNRLIFVIPDNNAAVALKIKAIDFSNLVDVTLWDKEFQCPTVSCNSGLARGLISKNDTEQVKLSLAYNDLILFVILNTTGGEVINSRYTFDDSSY